MAFSQGYESGLKKELDTMGIQLMVVPLGCPYDAAARVLKGKVLENTLPETALAEVRRDPAVAVAAPLLVAALPRANERRTEMWMGLDDSALKLKPWWQAKAGESWFSSADSVILGCDAAEMEMRAPGDRFYSPETKSDFRVAGVLERSGTSDDSLFFVPLRTAQRIFDQPGRLTAVAVRLRDPALLREASQRLQHIPGAQVVTLTEMTGVFLNLVGTARTFVQALAVMATIVCVLTVLNTLLSAVIERTTELSILRAVGASPVQLLWLVTVEAVLLTSLGSAAGIALAMVSGGMVGRLAKQFVPLAPAQPWAGIAADVVWRSVALGLAVGLLGGIYPAWRASRPSPASALKGAR